MLINAIFNAISSIIQSRQITAALTWMFAGFSIQGNCPVYVVVFKQLCLPFLI